MPPQSEENFYSSLGIKPLRSRGDHIAFSGEKWLKDKSEYDGAEGLWRIHDDLYDFSSFVDRHPGGAMWLKMTKGTDISEAFEAHHISLGPEKLLPKFQVRKASSPRNSPFTFHENGFYKQLKKHVREVLKTIPESSVSLTKIMTDSLFLGYIILSLLAARFFNFYIGTVAGVFLTWLTISAHNFFHQKDNFRMCYFEFSMLSFREWRISHALSHHLYTNTIIDMELQLFEPLLPYLPVKKSIFVRFGSWIYFPIIYANIFGVSYLRRIGFSLYFLRKNKLHMVDKYILIPWIVPLLMYFITGQSLINSLLMWFYIVTIGSLVFSAIGINAAHQAYDIFHDGDTPRAKSIDWGIAQLDTVMDRTDITGSHFLVLTNFGDHGLHHLFPTLDHGKLNYLYPTLENVCKTFNVELRMCSQWEMIKKGFIQLANTVPNPFPPGYKKTN